jgi:hypothetical protein
MSRTDEPGFGTMNQEEPFHCSMSDALRGGSSEATPTAEQKVVETHEIPVRLLSKEALLLGLGTIDHAVPFHCSMRVCWATPELKVPTAVQSDDETHETPARLLFEESLVFGLGTIDHATPSHRSMSVCCAIPELKVPTAVQSDGEMHETALRSLAWEALVLGLGTMDQERPLHRSTRD